MSPPDSHAHLRRLLAVVAAIVCVGFVAGLLIVGDDASDDVHTQTVDTNATAPGEQPKEITISQDAVDQAADAPASELDENLRDETPPGVPDEVLDAAREQQDALAENDQLPVVTPFAAPEQRGCITRLVRNHSSRRGVRPRLFVLHWTGSGNRAGWGDVNTIVGLFDQSSFAASSTYVIDAEGHCAYIVRESDKPWTQAAANPVSISVEQINPSTDATYAGKAGFRKLAGVMNDAMRRWEIPLQRGRTSGCKVLRPGITDHTSLGPCGGGHPDIGRYGPGCRYRAGGTDSAGCIATLIARIKLLRRHTDTHRKLRRLCSSEDSESKHPEACKKLRARNTQIHRDLGA